MNFEIAHLHTDVKFISGSSIFENSSIHNSIYFINNSAEEVNLSNDVICIEDFDKDFNSLIRKLNKSDLIVVWGLSSINQKIVLAVNKEVKIAWRFFGYELYGRIPEFIYSKETLKLAFPLIKRFSISNPFGRLSVEIIHRKANDIFKRSVERLNYFIGLSKKEYYFLKQQFPNLPEFISVPFRKSNKNFSYNKFKPYKVILGHNSHPFNNHIAVLKLLRLKPTKDDTLFYMLMSYGENINYINNIKEKANQISKLTIIDKMIPYDEFVEFYSNCHAFVQNAYRQCGMANIFIGLKEGVKIYLNRKNVIFEWLTEEGFLVFTIEDFKKDLISSNYCLSEVEALHNYNCFVRMTEKHSLEDFQNKIQTILT